MAELSFWQEFTDRHGLQGQYAAFKVVKRDGNKQGCIKCTTNTCCGYQGGYEFILGGEPYRFLAERGESRVNLKPKTGSWGGFEYACALLTADYMCAGEEAKPWNCLRFICGKMKLNEKQNRIWQVFSRAISDTAHRNEQNRFIGVYDERKDWLRVHPEYAETIKERLTI